PGQTLKEAVEAGKRFDENEMVTIAEDLLDVLDYLHHFSPPVIHRDIKPGNVILDPQGQAHLVDFGAVTDTLLHQEGGGSTIVGTFGYMPPEQLDGRAVPGSDLFGLGATLIFALSGLDPALIEKENLSLNFRPYVQVSEGLAQWLEKMTHPDWKQRFQSAQEAREALFDRHNRRKDAPAGRKTQSRFLLMLASAAVIIGLGLGLGGMLWLSGRVSSPPALTGSLSLAGQKSGLPTIEPRFWIVEQGTGQRVKPKVAYNQGQFKIQGLAPGSYGMNVAFDTNAANPIQYPGDLRAWSEFELKAGQAPPELQLDLIQLLHLTAPVDNNSQLAGWGQHCSGGSDLNGPAAFSWEGLGEGVSYDYQLLQVSCASADQASTVASGSISQTSLKLKLPPSPADSYYRFQLEARRDGHKIGRLRTHGSDDHDWDYNFRVR
ncbi:MAG: serine/threonine protein kinase, partial [Candidatus Sericytochromatia bacterium]